MPSTYERLDKNGLSYVLAKLKSELDEKAVIVSLTQAEYNALTAEEKNKPNIIYEITDAGSSSSGGHTILNASNVPVHNRTNLQFQGATVTDDETNDKTVVSFPNFITNTVSNLTNYYLKTEVDTLINTAKNGRYILVNTLPTEDIDTKAIYLVPKSTSSTNNIKDEYINLDGTSTGWEKIGDTEIDLSGYATTSAMNIGLAGKMNKVTGTEGQLISFDINGNPMAIDPSGGSDEIFQNVIYKNSVIRGKFLGTSISEDQKRAIYTGTFDDLYLGDYWDLDGTTFVIAGFDTNAAPDSAFNLSNDSTFIPHWVILYPVDYSTTYYNLVIDSLLSSSNPSGLFGNLYSSSATSQQTALANYLINTLHLMVNKYRTSENYENTAALGSPYHSIIPYAKSSTADIRNPYIRWLPLRGSNILHKYWYALYTSMKSDAGTNFIYYHTDIYATAENQALSTFPLFTILENTNQYYIYNTNKNKNCYLYKYYEYDGNTKRVLANIGPINYNSDGAVAYISDSSYSDKKMHVTMSSTMPSSSTVENINPLYYIYGGYEN